MEVDNDDINFRQNNWHYDHKARLFHNLFAKFGDR